VIQGTEVLRGLEIARDLLNDDGGLDREIELIFEDSSEELEELFGEPAQVVETTFAQRLVLSWLAQGPVAALIISERSYRDDAGEWTAQRGGITVLAGPRLECVEVPEPGGQDHAAFTAARLETKADAWPGRRTELRREIEAASDVEDRHFAIQGLIHEAYRLRNAHSHALDDAIAACREQISLAPSVAAVMRQRYEGRLPEHLGFKQLAIILEKQNAFAEAAELSVLARAQGWEGDWDKRLARLERKQR
jgi:hypothetical protein